MADRADDEQGVVRPAAAVRVVHVDPQPLFRLGLRRALRKRSDVELVAQLAEGVAAVKAVEELHPDVLLLDVDLPDIDGIDVVQTVAWQEPTIAVVVLTACAHPERVVAAIDAGASGYLLKTEEPSVVLAGLRAARAGHLPVSAALVRGLLRFRGADQSRTYLLTPREEQIVQLVAAGMKNKQIGRELGISDKTVKSHLTRIFQRIDVADRAQAAAWATEHLNGRHPRR